MCMSREQMVGQGIDNAHKCFENVANSDILGDTKIACVRKWKKGLTSEDACCRSVKDIIKVNRTIHFPVFLHGCQTVSQERGTLTQRILS